MSLYLWGGKILFRNGMIAKAEACCCDDPPPGIITECCPDRALPTYLYLEVTSAACACIGQTWDLTYVGFFDLAYHWRSPEWDTPADRKYLGTGDCALEDATYSSYRYAWQVACQYDDATESWVWRVTFAATSDGLKIARALLNNAFNQTSTECDPFELTGTHDWDIAPEGCDIDDPVTITVTEV